jgi:CubicO group peptidase (beta-lactamase class C family)
VLFRSYQGKRLLSAVSVENMSMVQTGDLQAGHDPGDGFGLTWEETKDPIGMLYGLSKGAFHHGGAFGTFGYIDPPKDLVGVYMTQWDGPDEKLPRAAFVEIGAASIQE